VVDRVVILRVFAVFTLRRRALAKRRPRNIAEGAKRGGAGELNNQRVSWGGGRSRSIFEVQRSNSGEEERLRSGGGRSEGLPHKRKSLDLRETNAQE
jgi:hypothetical protein